MAYVTIAELKAVLGVGSLYSDADLQQVCDAADNLVDGLLKYNRSVIKSYAVDANVVTAYMIEPHSFNVGDTVVISRMGATFNGSRTVLEVGTHYFTFAVTTTDSPVKFLVPGALATGPNTIDYTTIPAVQEAALALAVDMWQARLAAGGQLNAVDFTPGPYRFGRSIMQKVIGLLAPYLDESALLG